MIEDRCLFCDEDGYCTNAIDCPDHDCSICNWYPDDEYDYVNYEDFDGPE